MPNTWIWIPPQKVKIYVLNAKYKDMDTASKGQNTEYVLNAKCLDMDTAWKGKTTILRIYTSLKVEI